MKPSAWEIGRVARRVAQELVQGDCGVVWILHVGVGHIGIERLCKRDEAFFHQVHGCGCGKHLGGGGQLKAGLGCDGVAALVVGESPAVFVGQLVVTDDGECTPRHVVEIELALHGGHDLGEGYVHSLAASKSAVPLCVFAGVLGICQGWRAALASSEQKENPAHAGYQLLRVLRVLRVTSMPATCPRAFTADLAWVIPRS